MYYMTKPTPERRAKLCSFRLEDENLASIDELALRQGVSRSQWIRQAVLAELVLELAGEQMHKVTHTEVEQQDLPDEPSVEELGDRPNVVVIAGEVVMTPQLLAQAPRDRMVDDPPLDFVPRETPDLETPAL